MGGKLEIEEDSGDELICIGTPPKPKVELVVLEDSDVELPTAEELYKSSNPKINALLQQAAETSEDEEEPLVPSGLPVCTLGLSEGPLGPEHLESPSKAL